MWGWLSSIISGLETVWEAITNIPQLIFNLFKTLFDNLSALLSDIWDSLTSLPELILEGIKEIFIPDSDYIESAFSDFLNDMKMKFNVDTSMFESLFTSEKPVDDVYVDYGVHGVGNFNLKVFDTKYLIDGVAFFRPIVRGFLVLLMFLYNIKQLIGFFGYNAGVVQGRSDWIDYNRTNTGGHKE